MVRTYLETSTARYLLEQGRMHPVEAWGPGFAQVFTTHDRDWSFGVLEVQGPVKFAEPLVRRTLRERRELTEGDQLLLYRVVRMGDRFQAVYGIISRERFDALSLARDERVDGMALFDAVSVVLGLLQGCRPGKARGVIVLISGGAVVGIGDRRNCHWLVPMAVSDGRLEPILERVRAEAAWRKLTIQGIDLVHALDESGSAVLPGDARQWPTRGYALGEARFLSSLETLLPRLPLIFSPITREERLHRPLERAEPLAWAVLAAAGAMLFGFGFWQLERAAEVETRTAALRGQVQMAPAPAADATSEAGSHLGVAAGLAIHPIWEDLHRLHDAVGPALARPLAGEALARLAAANQGLGRISEIVITEGADNLVVRITGGLPEDMPENLLGERDAGALFQRLLLGLSAQGFAVQERLLELTPGKATFTVTAALGRSARGTAHAGWPREGAP